MMTVNRCLSFLVPLVATCLGGLTSGGPTAGADPGGDKVKALLAERLVTLRKIAELAEAAHNAGSGSREKMVEARFAVLAAELDLCETSPDRVKVLERVVAEAKRWEAVAEEGLKTRTTPPAAALAAKVRRLEAEIKLERAKSEK